MPKAYWIARVDLQMGAAMFMVMCRSLLYSCASRELSPAKVLAELNAKILEVSTADLFVTVFYGVLDTADQSFRYTNAGHNPPLWYHAQDGTVSNITVPGIALGVIDDMDLGEAELKLGPGDRLVLYTDGVTEAIDAGEHQFGLPRLTAVVADGAADSPETVKAIQAAVNTFVGGQPQFDDMTLAVVHAAAEGPSMVDLLREIQARG